ncbi:MAG: hypothetical protein MI919_17965 [Holophagales bacterium]|nr:hypothetical protein [Holophagales bacterium]
MSTEERDLLRAIGELVDASGPPAPSAGPFGSAEDPRFRELARRAFAFQYRRIEAIRRLCDARGVRPGGRDRPFQWRHVPAVPVVAFKTLALHAAPPREIFRSSGTLGGEAERSVHHHPYPDLYRRVIDATFAPACLPESPGRRPLLSLVPARALLPDSSLGFMVDHVLRRHGDASSRVAFGEHGVELEAAWRWCAERESDARPGTVLATAFALAQWLDACEAAGRVFRLPPGSTIFETGGFKGRSRELSRSELLERIERFLGVSPGAVVREYGMTELPGHLYTAVLRGGDPDVFYPPPFLRVHLLDPETLQDVRAGEPGLVAVLDLANLGSAIHVLSQDLGAWDADAGGLRLLGRAGEAELRGCSLTVEELAGDRG